jgi:hypothetical protein
MRHQYSSAVLLAFVLAVPAAAQVPPEPPRPPRPPRPPHVSSMRERLPFEEKEQKTFTLSNAADLDLSNIAGDITVTAGRGNDAIIEVTKHGYGNSQEDAKRQLGFVEVRFDQSGGRGEVRTQFVGNPEQRGERHQRNFQSEVEYRVSAPEKMRLRVKTISGNIKSSQIKGDQSLESISGNVNIDGAGVVSMAKSISGDVTVTGMGSANEPLSVSSISGDVRVDGVKARYIEVSSISGDIVTRNVGCERATVSTVSGDVQFSGPVAKAGRYEFKSHSGDIRFAVTNDAGFDVEANSFSGDIKSELPIKNQAAAEEDEMPAQYKRHMPKRTVFRGTYKDGSATVELTTFSGDIVITK